MTDITAKALPGAQTAPPPTRIVTLDIVRGIAVMGILAMNIAGFAMPAAAYMNPLAYGTESVADLAAWAFNFILVDGKMRGLFSFLFGASMLLVIERAEATGRSPVRVHYVRMFWLLVFGLIHFYLIWFGDILSLYAMVGMVAFLFRRLQPTALVIAAIILLVVQMLFFGLGAIGFHAAAIAAAAPDASAEAVRAWQDMQTGLGLYEPAALQAELARHLGPWSGVVHHQVTDGLWMPLVSLGMFGWETLAYFLLGMAAYRTGFLTDGWTHAAYRRTMIIGFGIGIPVYALLAWVQLANDFWVPTIFLANFTLTVAVRPLMIAAIAALIIVATRGGGPLVDRIAAAGRAAFSNYLGTSIIMTFIFYGWGLSLYGSLSRVELWIPVVLMWLLMLAWSRPWLDHYRYGPLEHLWRSLSRGRAEPLRRTA